MVLKLAIAYIPLPAKLGQVNEILVSYRNTIQYNLFSTKFSFDNIEHQGWTQPSHPISLALHARFLNFGTNLTSNNYETEMLHWVIKYINYPN